MKDSLSISAWVHFTEMPEDVAYILMMSESSGDYECGIKLNSQGRGRYFGCFKKSK
jgi:hypothetical protein